MAHALDLSFVTPAIACGARFGPEHASHLARVLGVRRVVDLREEARDDEAVLRAHGLRLLHLPTEDHCAVAEHAIERGVAWVAEGLGRGERCLLHCEHGIGRSALLTLCVLVHEGREPLAALSLCKEARPAISPSPAQLEALLAYCARPEVRRRDWGPLPSFDALAAIAYRHLVREASRAPDATESTEAKGP